MFYPKVQLKRFVRAETSGTVKIVQKNLVNNGAANKRNVSFISAALQDQARKIVNQLIMENQNKKTNKYKSPFSNLVVPTPPPLLQQTVAGKYTLSDLMVGWASVEIKRGKTTALLVYNLSTNQKWK